MPVIIIIIIVIIWRIPQQGPDRGGLQVYSTSLHHKNQAQMNKEKKEKEKIAWFRIRK